MVAGTEAAPADPDWDQILLDAFVAGNLSVLDRHRTIELTGIARRGGHEFAASGDCPSALHPGYTADVRFYKRSTSTITGIGILTGQPAA